MCKNCADLTLGPCEVRCNDGIAGSGYSTSLCTTKGYRSDYIFMLTPNPTLKNAGGRAVTFAAGAKLWSVDGQTPTDALAPSTGLYLAAGAELPGPNQPYKLLGTPAPGTYKVTFRADPDNLIEEANEGNNVSVCAWTVVAAPTGAPDLTITSLVMSPTSGPRTATFKQAVTVKNVGTADSPGFHTSCQPGNAWNQPNLAAGASVTTNYDIPNVATIPVGTHTVTCTVSPFFPEKNQSNNSATATLTITQ